MKKTYTREEVMGMLRKFCTGKTQTAAANELGVNSSVLCDLLKNRRDPGPSVLKYFNLVKMNNPPTYRKVS